MGESKQVVAKPVLVMRYWREFVEGLMEAREAWEKLQGVMLEMPNIDMLPEEWQGVMTKVPYQSRFEIALDLLMGYWQVQGGMEILLPPKKVELKQVKKDGEKA